MHIHVYLTVNGLSLGVEDHADSLCHAGRKPLEELWLQLTPALLGARPRARFMEDQRYLCVNSHPRSDSAFAVRYNKLIPQAASAS